MPRYRLLISLFATLTVALFAPAAAGADSSFSSTALEKTTGAELEDIAVGDLDGHNGPDVVTAYKEGGVGVHLNDGHGHFGPEHLYATGCKVPSVEIGDVGSPGGATLPDGHLDVVIACEVSENQVKYLARMFGDGNGGLSEPLLASPELTFGSFGGGEPANPQQFALAGGLRDPGLGPVVIWGFLAGYYSEGQKFTREICRSYDWKTRVCTGVDEPGIQAPVVAGIVADARVFAGGGGEKLIDWGEIPPPWHYGTREIGPEPKFISGEANWDSIAIGDLQGDGPDILSSVGRCGCLSGQEGPYGRVSVLYGNVADGVLPQHATTFASAPGVMDIASGDFDLDGHTDVAGTAFHNAPEGYVDEVFVQHGNGGGELGAPQHFRLGGEYRYSSGSLDVADFDANGSADIAAVAGQDAYVLLNGKAAPAPVSISAGAAGAALAGVKGLPKKTNALKSGTVLLGTATNPPTAGVDITLTVPPADGKAKGSALAAAAKPKRGKKKKETVIGKASIKVPAGKTVKLKVKLKPKGLALLKKGSIHAKLTLVATSTSGTKQTKKQSLTIKPVKAKKKGKKRTR